MRNAWADIEIYDFKIIFSFGMLNSEQISEKQETWFSWTMICLKVV